MDATTQQLFQHLARYLAEPLLALSIDGQIVQSCPAVERLLAREEGSSIGHPLSDLVTDSPGRLAEYLRMCGRTLAPIPGALTLRQPSGQLVACRIRGALLAPPPHPPVVVLRIIPKDGSHSPFALLNQKIAALSAEVVKRKHAEEEALRAVHARDEFLAVASHEFKTPLQSLTLQLELIGRSVSKLGTDVEQRLASKIETMKGQVDRLGALSRGLLDLTADEAGQPSILCRADLSEVVRTTVGRIAIQIARAGCELRLELEPHAFILLDVSRVDQILVNLLSNAAKYGAGKPLHISVKAEGQTVTLAVRDLGIGIAAADQARIFEKFERAVSHEHFGGLGLGLFISRQLAQAMRAVLSVSSVQGEGATFSLQFAAAPHPVAESAQ
jgi:signal transduction histidine kinase